MGLFAEAITEKQYFEDLAKAKIIVDMGIKDWFIYAFPSSIQTIDYLPDTLLKDVVNVFGPEYVRMFRFAAFIDCGNNGSTSDEYQFIQIRPITNHDKKQLTNDFRFFPQDTWVCDWRSADGHQMLLPFTQDNNTANIKWLMFDNSYRKTRIPSDFSQEDFFTMPTACVAEMINIMPDYWDMQLAVHNYKGVDICIPLAGNTAKKTFKNRDRDEVGVKRHICHSVKSYTRINSEKEVERHIRGKSALTINGTDVYVLASYEYSVLLAERLKNGRPPRSHKKSRRRK